jgi:DNA modification methylase
MFLGSGVTALESLLLNRRFVGYDLNPISIFITKNTIKNHINMKKINYELSKIVEKIEPIFLRLYSTNELCEICGNKLIIQHLNIGPKFKGQENGVFFCPNCGKNKTKIKRKLNDYDYALLNKKYHPRHWIPTDRFPDKFFKDRFSYKGISKVSEMFTDRNLFFLSELLYIIKEYNFEYKNLFLLAFSNTVLHASKLKSENVRPLSVNNYWIPDDYFEENPWIRFLDRFNLIIKSKKILSERNGSLDTYKAHLYNKSCFNTKLGDQSVDYIFTDPPYGEAIQYSELSFIWNAWLGYKYNNKEELVINPVQDKNEKEYFDLFEKSISEASRVLKPHKYFTLCFHNKTFNIWKGVLDVFKKYNFMLDSIDILKPKGNSYNNNWAKFSPKTDIYLTFIKKRFSYTHKKEYSISALISEIQAENLLLKPTELYDILITKLIKEIYFNKFQLDISNLSIKELSNIIKASQNGN